MSHCQKRPTAKMPNHEEPYRPSNDRPRNHESVSSRSKAVDQIDSVPLNTEFEQGQIALLNRGSNQSTKKMEKHSKLFTPDAEMQKEEMAQRVRKEKRKQRKNMKKDRANKAKQIMTSCGNRSCGLKKIGTLVIGGVVVFSGIIGKMAYDGYAQSANLDAEDPLHEYLNGRRMMEQKPKSADTLPSSADTMYTLPSSADTLKSVNNQNLQPTAQHRAKFSALPAEANPLKAAPRNNGPSMPPPDSVNMNGQKGPKRLAPPMPPQH